MTPALFQMLKHADILPGGLADRKKPSDFPATSLAAGRKVELEHTKIRPLATEIAMDHLTEDPRYYEKLKKVEKTAAPLAPSERHQEKLDSHFSSDDPKKWRLFRRNLRAKSFAEAVAQDERSDSKLKKFSKMISLHQTGKGPTMKVQGTGKTHTVKYHPELSRYTCSCGDWTFVKSLKPVSQADCKHIAQVKSQSSMVKKASQAWLMKQIAGAGRLGLQVARKENNEEQAWHAGEVNKIHRRVGLKKEAEIRGLAAQSLLQLVG